MCTELVRRGDRYPARLRRLSRLLLAAAWYAVSLAATAGEAPLPPDSTEAGPLPSEAEAAYQDLTDDQSLEIWLDEAVFTEISPLTIPEVGIALPADQEP